MTTSVKLTEEHKQKLGSRKFFHIDDALPEQTININESTEDKKQQLIKYIQDSIIGDNELFKSPFGYRMVTYCDYVASGRALTFIEDYIRSQVLTMYANTHTSTSITGLQSSLFRIEARQIIRNNVNCSKKDVLLFTGSGSTSALNKLVHLLDLDSENGQKAIVFVGPYEHHSNILPWREARGVIKVVNISETPEGYIDMDHLERELKMYSEQKDTLLVGAFSAASNITGVLSDTVAITILLHKYKAFAVWDYACAAPYVKIDVNPNVKSSAEHEVDQVDARKDAVFFSPHKFIGGVETPGVLIVKKHLFLNERRPQQPGGGTVFFVTDKDHRYLKKKYEREEGGTPSIVGSIRTGLVFQLKNAVGDETITNLEQELCTRALKTFNHPKIVLLGPHHAHKLPIFSFLIRHNDAFLHYGFVSVLLNDLFGIQSRGGCACAGPYGLRLLGISYELAKQFENELLYKDNEHEFLRPGFTRINLNYFFDKEAVDFVLEAITFVAEHGWKFLPQYTFYPETGEWYHINNKKFLTRRWLSNISYAEGKMIFRQPVNQQIAPDQKRKQYAQYFKEAQEALNQVKNVPVPEQNTLLHQTENSDRLRWFIYPSEAAEELRSGVKNGRRCAFEPKRYSSIVKPIVEELAIVNKHVVNDESHKNGFGEAAADIPNGLVDHIIKYSEEPKKGLTEKQLAKQLYAKLWPRVPNRRILGPMKKAIKEFGMIKNGDRILLGLSGGKDSLTLLHCLKALQSSELNIEFEFGACTVDPQTDAYDPSPLKNYLAKLGVPYFFESQNIIEVAKDCQASSICSWCSRMKRGILYNTARREGYNVLALGQHLDDLAESFIMSIFHNGFLRTMKAHYTIDEGDLRVIRPLVHVRERELKKFAQEQVLPVINENCPACFEIPKERARVKTLLYNQEHLYPDLFHSLQQAIRPLMEKDIQVAGHKKFKSNKSKIFKKSAGDDLNDDNDVSEDINKHFDNVVVDEKKVEKLLEEVTHKKKQPTVTEILRSIDTDSLIQELLKRGVQVNK
jgi:selenocysteine lyase/cysteine desulfurase/tRNA(Ile)-lysidine synthase TilS/MesJ